MPNWIIRRGAWRSPAPKRSGSHALIRRGLLVQMPPPRLLLRSVMRRGTLVQSKFTGNGYFAGTVGSTGIVTVDGKPARRKIYLLDHATMQFVRSTWSNDDGSYRLSHLDPSRQYCIVALDNYNSTFPPVAWDKLTPAVDSGE